MKMAFLYLELNLPISFKISPRIISLLYLFYPATAIEELDRFGQMG